MSLPLLKKKDTIYVVQKRKTETVVKTYVVNGRQFVDPDDVHVLDQERAVGKKIALGTCVPIG